MKLVQGAASRPLTLQLHVWLQLNTSALLFGGVSLSSLGHWCQWYLCSCQVGQASGLAQNYLKKEFSCKLTWLTAWKCLAVLAQGRQWVYPAGKGHCNPLQLCCCPVVAFSASDSMYLSPAFVILVLPCHSCSMSQYQIRLSWGRLGGGWCWDSCVTWAHHHCCLLSASVPTAFLVSFFFIHASAALSTCYSCYSWPWCLALSGRKAVVPHSDKSKC